MRRLATHLNRAVATLFLSALLSAGAFADGLDDAFARLADPENPEWRLAQSDIERAWSRSGSAAMDLLLKRGQEALKAGDLPAAIEHLTALVDHAPDFAEGWNARATAYFLAGEIGPSVADIERTLALEPRHFGALSGLGRILEETGDKAAALRAYRAALAINPHLEPIRDAAQRIERETEGTEI